MQVQNCFGAPRTSAAQDGCLSIILNAACYKHASPAVIARSVREADRTDKQDARVPRHPVQHCGEFRQLHLERMELLAHTRARTLQRLYQLARALVPRRAQV